MPPHPLAGLAVSALGCLVLSCSGPNEYVEPPPPTVTVAPPVQKTVTDYLEFSGTSESIATVEIRARVRGYLQERLFDEGTIVSEGDLLFVIDPREYEAAVARAEASLQVARTTLGLFRARLARKQEAQKKRAVSELEVIEARAERDAGIARVAAAEAALKKAKLDLSYTQIRSPITGRAGRRLVDVGNLVGAGENTLLTTIVQFDPMYVYFDVSERDLLRIMEDTPEARTVENRDERESRIALELGLANEEGFPHRGTVDYSDQGVDSSTGTLLVRGVFPNPEPMFMLPGFFARVRFPYQERENALLVTERALGRDQSGSFLLVVDDDDVVQYRSVALGARVEGMRVVESGLEPDDRVIVNGVLFARPGARVNPVLEGSEPQAEPMETATAEPLE